jgi:hypothetical protein
VYTVVDNGNWTTLDRNTDLTVVVSSSHKQQIKTKETENSCFYIKKKIKNEKRKESLSSSVFVFAHGATLLFALVFQVNKTQKRSKQKVTNNTAKNEKMGPAHSTVVNKTHKKLCVVTFNNADLLYHCE